MFYAKELDHYYNKTVIGVFCKENDNKVGEFERNYDSYGVETFAPFQRGNNWYALYSKRYTGLSVMSLPSSEYLGSEDTEAEGFGFCPMEVYIPRFQWSFDKGLTKEEMIAQKIPEQNWHWVGKGRYSKEFEDYEIEQEVLYENFAFVTGTYWACSWEELQIRDISRAHEGIITNLPEWKSFQPNHKLSLKDSVRLSAFDQYDKEEPSDINITMTINKTVRICKDGSIKEFD